MRSILALSAVFVEPPDSTAQVVYSADFEAGAASAEWSDRTLSTSPRNARRFLGRFGEETVNLTLLNLPGHTAVTITFDLYVIQSWDGNDPTFGPDLWTLSVPGERTLVHTSFNTGAGAFQNYPGSFPATSYPGLTGAAERSTLGYAVIQNSGGVGDSVYRFEITFAHSDSALVLAFAGSLNEILSNESWGLDNVVVSVSSPPGGIIEFDAPSFFGSEGADNAVLALRRSGAITATASTEYGSTNGFATALDYTPSSGSVNFAAGESRKDISVPLLDDALVEIRDESFMVSLLNPQGGAVLGSSDRAVFWIYDNDVSDPHFRRHYFSPLAHEGGGSGASAWGDYDADGYPDLFVGNYASQRSFLYRNLRNGNLEKVGTGSLATDLGTVTGAAWADYDNDGDLDLATTKYTVNHLHRNNGGGIFTRSVIGSGTLPYSNGCAWADYDNDGFVDLFIATDDGPNLLFRNNRQGGFTRVLAGAIATDVGNSESCAWGDYNNDGFVDLFVANQGGQPNFLYHNNGNGTFMRVTAGAIATDIGQCYAAAWGDYDNDGFLDLFVSNFGETSFFYRNNRDGTFTRTRTGPGLTPERSLGCTWTDFDNDGDLDFFVANFGATSALYLNNGNATFTKRNQGLIARDLNPALAVAAADHDGDGDQDVFIARYQQLNNGLYVNEGSSNRSLTVRLRGVISNRSAIGAKVRLTTRVNDTEVMQLREISGGSGRSQAPLEAHFGVGPATEVDLAIAWPSGATQSWTGLKPGQVLHIAEAPQLQAEVPSGTLVVASKPGAAIFLESSPDLASWAVLLQTNAPGASFEFTDPASGGAPRRFYRAGYLEP